MKTMTTHQAVVYLYQVSAIFGSRPFARFFGADDCIFGITSLRLHSELRRLMIEPTSRHLLLDPKSKDWFKQVQQLVLTGADGVCSELALAVRAKERTFHLPRRAVPGVVYRERFGLASAESWLNWYRTQDKALQGRLSGLKVVVFELARFIEARHTLAHGVDDPQMQAAIDGLLRKKGEDWLIGGLPHDLLSYAPLALARVPATESSRILIACDQFAVAEVRYGEEAVKASAQCPGYQCIDISTTHPLSAVA